MLGPTPETGNTTLYGKDLALMIKLRRLRGEDHDII
jgi:hypothetical protein